MATEATLIAAGQLNCPFCREFSTGVLQDCDDATFNSRVLTATSNFVVVPDISPLAPGHVMILPKEHIISFGALSTENMLEVNELIAKVRRILSHYYEPPVILEHGTNSFSAGGGCVSHAHLHFFPRAIDLRPALKPYSLSTVEQFSDLRAWAAKDRSYVFFERENGKKYVADHLHGIPRQFIRIEIARQIGLPAPRWNWREHILLENLEATFKTLSTAKWL